MRHFFSFLFKHDWDYDVKHVEVKCGVAHSSMVCKLCGIRSATHALFDFGMWKALRRTRGCPGEPMDGT